MRRAFLLTLLCLSATMLSARSIVLTLNDGTGTRVFFQLGGDEDPRMVFNGDGTLTVHGLDYAIAEVKCFAYTTANYEGEKGTVNGIRTPQLVIDGKWLRADGRQAPLVVYDLDGRKCADGTAIDLSTLPSGRYVATDGTSTLKFHRP